MPTAEIKERITEIRHWLHQHPETAMEEYQTSAYIADIMEELGCQVTRGVGGTGVVATMTRGDSGRMIGLRADIDALPMTELAESPWKSTTPGKFHGCGHDSHAASLIGAAMLLRENPDFNGTVVFLFQPGEAPGVGAKAMIEDGLFERFPMQEIYGQHNKPQLPLGQIAVRPGKFMSSEDDFWITIHGLGGHASAPHNTRDPLVTAAEIVLQLQTVISRSLNPLEAGTISCCDIKTDGVLNAIPSTGFSMLKDGITWGAVGLLLIPIISAAMQLVVMKISMKGQSNNSAAAANKSMLLMMPLFSLWIGFTLPAALGVYWISQSVFSAIQEFFMGKFYNKKLEEEEEARYQARQADRQKRMEEGRKRQEEIRQQGAQKQSLKEKRKAAQEAKAQKAKKAATSTTEAGRVGDRPYARGRSYKADRYGESETK